MFSRVTQMILVLSMSYLLGNTLYRLVSFISSHDILGSYGRHYPLLRYKKFKFWTDTERHYVMIRIMTDILLLGLFLLQHSFMAKDCWKRCLLRFNIFVSERMIYNIASCLALNVMITRWASTPDVMLWVVDTHKRPALWLLFSVLHGVAWAIIFFQVRLMDPLEFLGLEQLYYYYQNMSSPILYKPQGLRLFYQHMRHGGTMCLWLMLWVHPVMTLDRFLLALVLSFYMPMAHRVTLSDYRFSCCYFNKPTHLVTSTTSSTKRKSCL